MKLDDGTWRSYKTSSKTEVSFGAKKGTEVMEPIQVLKLYKGDQLVAEYWDYEVDRVVCEEKRPITGTVNATINGVETPVKWVQLWKGGPKFAEYNIGATSATDYGGYYAWGGSQEKIDDHNTTNTGAGNLTSTDDTATKLWGGNWRMPTRAELEALLNSQNCTCTWITQNNVNGLLCRGKEGTAFESNSVFLPAAGHCYDDDVLGQGDYGDYWSSSPNGDSLAYRLHFLSGDQYVGSLSRYVGCSVRAVLAE